MSAHRTPEDLARWLDAATRGLPADVKAAVRAEIEAHYEDAVQEHQANGKIAEVARRAALADLGAAAETGRALRETHLAHRWYTAAFVVGLLFPLSLWLGSTIEEALYPLAWGRPIQELVVLLPTFFILYVFRKLMAQRTFSARFDLPTALLVAGTLVGDGFIDAGRLILYPILEDDLWNLAPGPALVFLVLALAGVFVSGISLFLLAGALLEGKDSLYGLRMPMVVLLAICGLSMFGFGAGVIGHDYFVANLWNLLTLLTHLVIIALLTLLFFRVVYRGSRQRVKAA